MIVTSDTLIAGLSIGAILLLVALGLGIIYGVMGVINLAHGDFVMIGAYTTWVLEKHLHISFFVALPAAFLVGAILGVLVERGVVQYLYTRPLETILATWGISIVLQEAVNLLAGSNLKYVELPASLHGSAIVFGLSLPLFRVFVLGIAVALLALTVFILYRTDFGLRVRAVMQNREIAEAFGTRAKMIYVVTFAYGSGIAALAGALVAPIKSVSPTMGTGYVVDAFITVVVGGVGSLVGLVVSSGIIGEAESIFGFIWNATLAKVLIFTAVVVLLRYRPSGLFGRTMRYGR
jgi:urea transport system permease protein